MALKKAEKKVALMGEMRVAKKERKKDKLMADKKVDKRETNLVGTKAGVMVA